MLPRDWDNFVYSISFAHFLILAMARLIFKAQNPLNAILMVFIVYFSLTYH